MTERQLQARVKFWQKRLAPLGLEHWRLDASIVDSVPGKPYSEAASQCQTNYDSAFVWFKRADIDRYTPQELDETIIHELLHVAWRDLEHIIASLCSWLPPAAWTDFEEQHDHEIEGLVERLARTLYLLHAS